MGKRLVTTLVASNGRFGLLASQALPDLPEPGPVGGRPQAVVPDLVDAGGQDVLKEATHKLLTRNRHRTPLVVPGVLVAEGHLAVLDTQDAMVGNGDPMDVASQVRQDVLGALDGRLAVDHPLLPAYGIGNPHVRQGFGHQAEEDAAEDWRQGPDRHEVVFAGRPPLPVGRQSPTGDQTVDVGMVRQCTAPGVQDGQDADKPADIVRVGRQLDRPWLRPASGWDTGPSGAAAPGPAMAGEA